MSKLEERAPAIETSDNASWVAGEVAGCKFSDARLGKRLSKLLDVIGASPGKTLPGACRDWANTKAAYRFLSNEDVNELAILAGHFDATRDRARLTSGPVLVLHDTTAFSYMRSEPELVGLSGGATRNHGQASKGRASERLMHSSLALTSQGVPLGLCAIEFWSRSQNKDDADTKRPRARDVPIEQKETFRWLKNLQGATQLIGEPGRCVHIGDRESDIFELFTTAKRLETNFLVRSGFHNRTHEGRLSRDGLKELPVRALHRVELREATGAIRSALLEIRYCRAEVLAPANKRQTLAPLELTFVFAQERDAPIDATPLEWKLVTNLEVACEADAIEKIEWYAMRWKIETFHKILKSGCKAEDAKLRTAQRLTNLIAVYCVVSWRIFWLTMLARAEPHSKPTEALTPEEIKVLDALTLQAKAKSKSKAPAALPSPYLTPYIVAIAKLGGYLARNNDPAPGNTLIWRGLTRLTDILLGAELMREVLGN